LAKSVDFDLVDILDIAQQLNLELHSIQGGKQYEVHCWMCGDKSKHGKLTINPSKGVFRCVKCGYSGNVYTMAKDILGSKERALELLAGNKLDYQPQQRRKRELPKENPAAPIEIRHAVYNAFLKKLILHPSHRLNLRNRGLTNAVIEQKGYKSTLRWDSTVGVCYLLRKEGYSLQGIPGFYEKDGQWLFMTIPGFLIPIRDKENRIQGLQIRVDDNTLKQKPDLSKYLWKSSAGKHNGTSSGTPVHIARPNKPTMPNIAYITEGPLKADIAAEYLGATFIGIAGVGLYKQAVEAAKEMGITTAPILFDMDKLKNKDVKKAEAKLLEELRKTGIETFSIEWNPKAGKGVDDVVITHGPKFKELIDTQIMQHKTQTKQKAGILHWGKRKKAM
jgi:hypothetical protein